MRNLNSMDPQMSTEVSKKGELITSGHSHPSTSRARDGEAQREWARVRLDQRPTCRQNALLLSLPPFQRTVCVHTLCIARGDRGRHTACTHLRYRQRLCLGSSKHSADHQSVYGYVLKCSLPKRLHIFRTSGNSMRPKHFSGGISSCRLRLKIRAPGSHSATEGNSRSASEIPPSGVTPVHPQSSPALGPRHSCGSGRPIK